MPQILDTMNQRPVVSSLAAGAVAITAILGGARALDIRLIPWATASEISALSAKINDRDVQIMALIQSLAAQQKTMQVSQNALLREFWEKRVEEADAELAENPRSRTAKAQHDEATRNIAMIDRATLGLPPAPVTP